MGTRSTVKFYEDEKNILSLYQQYDGYVSGVGKQVADLLEGYKVVNGLAFGDENKGIANGIRDLALFYILDNKKESGNLYASTSDGSEEFNYEVHAGWGKASNDQIRVKVTDYEDEVLFEGTATEFIEFVKNESLRIK